MIELKDEKKYHCPFCSSIHTRRRGIRKGAERYQCQECLKWFQISRVMPRISAAEVTIQHLAGLPFRALANQHEIGVGTAYRKVQTYLEELPHCADVTREYCQKFSGILLVDGKYVKVKGYDRKIPVVYGIDYTTHDIPHFILSKAENYQTCHAFFQSLYLMNYPLQALVCDDNQNIYESCQRVYPRAAIQLCQVHYLRNIKMLLDLENHPTYQPFFTSLCLLFDGKRSPADFDKRAGNMLQYFGTDRLCVEILIDLERRKQLLLGYRNHRGTPTTTNLIESFNSHLQGRLDTIKGFESFKHADTWLNAYFLKRRMTKFTDCSGKFKHLNGKTSLSQTQKTGIDLPTFF